MPSLASTHTINVYKSARDLPLEVWEAFHAHPRNSNIIYPHASKAKQQSRSNPNVERDTWIVCTTPGGRGRSSSLDFVLSCTEGPLDSYPIFIFTPIPISHLDPNHYRPRLRGLIHALQECVPPERVFSVFSLNPISRAFADIWTHQTGIGLDDDPIYYEAKLTYCTKATLTHIRPDVLQNTTYRLRLANERDVPEAAKLCHGFAAVSEPFTLNKEQAIQEAAHLIRNKQLWVHDVMVSDFRSEIASIVAVTRTSETVASVTKVFTDPRWRHYGCAERLTRHVTQCLLESKDSVMLYVAHNNPAAAKVYHRVGFVGLAPGLGPVEGVDSWLELGFDRNLVDLGHW
ncbi:uncharacterized protein FIBRA_06357 [Fibroporia radiculosa]|uniref:N-acetyltransferase domain-containing protein n=1 Tax=Fibroporia radiculosa TaxID=599839 RepID=J4IB79_9APHY|nr:uncharacterized protein FIBRA_06357 [Fibroporia radiculosa]CCM04191.1 predicted protein [Fibroporia radiculosa]